MEIRVGNILGPGDHSETFIEVVKAGRWKRLTKKASDKIFEIVRNDPDTPREE